MTTSENIEKIFQRTKSIAVIGFSPNPDKESHKIGKYLLEVGFAVYPVYPKEDYILEQKVYRDLNDIPHKIDLVNVFRRSEFIPEIFEEVAQRNQEKNDVRTLWLQLGIMHPVVAKQVEELGLDFVQNRCIMVEHLRVK
jgi:uncharacterized protein